MTLEIYSIVYFAGTLSVLAWLYNLELLRYENFITK